VAARRLPGQLRQLIESCQRAGFEPRIAAESADAQAVAGLVAAGLGVSILGSQRTSLLESNIALVPLREEKSTLHIVSRARVESPACRDFIAILLQSI